MTRLSPGPSLDSPHMPRLLLVFLSLALGATCAFALVACGSDDEGTIPPDDAQAMLDALGDAQAERDEQDCAGLADAAGNLITEVDDLPDSVDPEVRTALAEGGQNLQDLASDESKCEPAGPTGPTGPSGQQTETTEPATVPPVTETTTAETTTTEEQTVEEPPPSGGGGGQGPSGNQDEGQGPPGGVPPGQEEAPPTGGLEE
jgi:hypothetical protein